MRLWMLSGTTVAAATAMGLTLGSYAVSPQRSPLERDAEPSLYTDFEAPVADAADPGPPNYPLHRLRPDAGRPAPCRRDGGL